MATANFTTKPPMRDKLDKLVDEEFYNFSQYILPKTIDQRCKQYQIVGTSMD
jgi:hypothetical protein